MDMPRACCPEVRGEVDDTYLYAPVDFYHIKWLVFKKWIYLDLNIDIFQSI